MFCVENGTPTRSATTATNMDISLGTAGQDVDPDLAPMTEVNVDTLALDLQEIDVTTEIETIEEDLQRTEEVVGIATTEEMIVTTEQADAMTVTVMNAVAVQTVETSGEAKTEAGVQTEIEEEETALDVEVPNLGMKEREHHQEKTVNIHSHSNLFCAC